MDKVNYVIAAWSGNRRNTYYQPHLADPTFYLREQLDSLAVLQHDLTQITIAVPFDPDEPLVFTEYIDSLKYCKNTPIQIIRRHNIGMSYGSWSDVFGIYRDKFNYYILMEDDYKFSQDNFDSILKKYLEPGVGFVAGLVDSPQGCPLHASVGLGMCCTEALQKVWNTYGMLPHPKNNDYGMVEYHGQIGLSQAIIKCGWNIVDVLKEYRVLFRGSTIRTFGKEESPILIEPL